MTTHPAPRWGLVTLLSAVPVSVGAALAWHPADPTQAVELDGMVGRWLTIHLVLMLGMPLLALVVQWMLRGVAGRLAAFARAAVVPAAALYVAFDALLGIGTGVLVAGAMDLPAAERPGALALTQTWWEVPAVVSVIAGVAVAAWTLAIASAAVAIQRQGGARVAAWALAASAVLFAAGHPGVTGAASMAAMTVAIVAVARRAADRSDRVASPPASALGR